MRYTLTFRFGNKLERACLSAPSSTEAEQLFRERVPSGELLDICKDGPSDVKTLRRLTHVVPEVDVQIAII